MIAEYRRADELYFAVGDSQFTTAATGVVASFVAARSTTLKGASVLVSNMAVSGSHASDWVSRAGGSYYALALTAFQAARAAAPAVSPKGLLVYLGTNDPTSGNDTSASFTSSLTTMVANYRADLGLPQLRVLFAILPVTVGATKLSVGWASVRAQQVALHGLNAMTGVVMPEGPFADGLHWSGEGSLEVGTRFAQAWL